MGERVLTLLIGLLLMNGCGNPDFDPPRIPAHELWITIFNGLSLRTKYDAGTLDAEIDHPWEHRLSFLLDVRLIPGVTLIAGTRTSLSSATRGDTDAMLQTHFWF